MSTDNKTQVALTPRDLARRWKMHPGTLANWRDKYEGPIYFRAGAKILYRLKDILKYEEDHSVEAKK